MAQVTIGIPVYNGEAMIRECLVCLQRQTFTDFKVLICDNASTDSTIEICNEFAALDQRFQVFCSDNNIGHEANFRRVFDLCETKYFMWRADDDYTSDDYLALLFDALSQNETHDLAVASAITQWSPNTYSKRSVASTFPELDDFERLRFTLSHYHTAWFYGLWRSSAIEKIIHTIWRDFPFAHSRDHLTILRPILTNAIVVCPEATFFQRTYSVDKGDGMRGAISMENRILRLEKLMPIFYSVYNDEVRNSKQSNETERKLLNFRKPYTYQKLRASKFRILRLKVKMFLKKLVA